MLFSEIIGHEAIKQRLIQSVRDNRISHAQLFSGPQGCGKLALALAFAQYLACRNRNETDSCGVCPACKKYQKLAHPDLHFAFPVATTKSVSKNPVSDNFIKEWRELIIKSPYFNLDQWFNHIGIENKQGNIARDEAYEILRKLSRKTFESEYKVMIIWMAEKMNISSANKLLKIIEEPPEKTLFLLIAEDTEQIIRTIISRTQILKVPKIPTEDLQKALMQRENLAEKEALNIAHIANGNYIEAKRVIQVSEDDKVNFDLFVELMRLAYSKKVIELYDWVERVAKLGRERQKRLLNYASGMIRENFALNIGGEQKSKISYLANEEAAFSKKFSPFITEKNIFLIQEELNRARFHIERNGYASLILLDLSIKMIQFIRARS